MIRQWYWIVFFPSHELILVRPLKKKFSSAPCWSSGSLFLFKEGLFLLPPLHSIRSPPSSSLFFPFAAPKSNEIRQA